MPMLTQRDGESFNARYLNECPEHTVFACMCECVHVRVCVLVCECVFVGACVCVCGNVLEYQELTDGV